MEKQIKAIQKILKKLYEDKCVKTAKFCYFCKNSLRSENSGAIHMEAEWKLNIPDLSPPQMILTRIVPACHICSLIRDTKTLVLQSTSFSSVVLDFSSLSSHF